MRIMNHDIMVLIHDHDDVNGCIVMVVINLHDSVGVGKAL